MNLTLKIWRQTDTATEGAMHTYEVSEVSEDMSFLEMLDVLNERLNAEGEALRHDDQYAYVAAWEWAGEDGKPVLHKENLTYEFVEMKQRSYK